MKTSPKNIEKIQKNQKVYTNSKKESVADLQKDQNAKTKKELLYDSSGLMNKLEEFSEVWNDFPSVQNPKQNQWFSENGANSIVRKEDSRVTENNNSYNYKKISFKVTGENVPVNGKSFKPPKTSNDYKVNKEIKNTESETYKVDSSKKRKSTELLEEGGVESAKYDSRLADLKRQKAVQEQRQVQVEKKNIIKQALSVLDGKQKINKKIVFSDGEETEAKGPENHQNELEENKGTSNKRLFADDDDVSEPEVELKLNKQFKGKKGQKLLELQSKFANDSRFALDTRFYESGSEESEQEISENLSHNEEKQKQLAILERIVQRQIIPLSKVKNVSSKKLEDTLVRFDPSRPDHSKYIMEPKSVLKGGESPEKKKKTKKSLKDGDVDSTIHARENKTQVSTEKFYTVKEDLKEVLKTDSGTGFSLLKLFGSKVADDSNTSQEASKGIKKLKHKTRNPFKYDSSDSEPEENLNTPQSNTKERPKSIPVRTAASWRTTFFFVENDPRLQEALEFLKLPEEAEDNAEYAEKRKVLKDFIRNKFKNNNRKKNSFKKKLGGLKKRSFQKKKRKQR